MAVDDHFFFFGFLAKIASQFLSKVSFDTESGLRLSLLPLVSEGTYHLHFTSPFSRRDVVRCEVVF